MNTDEYSFKALTPELIKELGGVSALYKYQFYLSDSFELVRVENEKSFTSISYKSFISVVAVLLVIIAISGIMSLFIPQGSYLRDATGQIINVGCMMPYMNYIPRTFEEIIEAGKEKYGWLV